MILSSNEIPALKADVILSGLEVTKVINADRGRGRLPWDEPSRWLSNAKCSALRTGAAANIRLYPYVCMYAYM